jgi:archaellum biogenesis ATPase FlaH
MSLKTTTSIDLANGPALIIENERMHFHPTRFKFVSDHKSFRLGKMHIILGTTGVGKTSLTRAMLKDLASSSRVLIYSTEETKAEFETQLAYGKSQINTSNLKYIHEDDILSMPDMNEKNIDGLINALDWAIAESKAEIVIIDNITASAFFQNIELAPKLSQKLRTLMKKVNAPFIVVAHTASTVKEGVMFDSSDMRGSKMLAIRAEYVYCIGRFTQIVDDHSRTATFVKVDKSRGHDNSKELYRLWYDASIKEYTCDENYEYSKFLEFTKPRKKKNVSS